MLVKSRLSEQFTEYLILDGIGFSNLSWRHPCPAHFACLPHLIHLIQIISSSVETARSELGMSNNKGHIQNVESRGASRTGLKTSRITYPIHTLDIPNSGLAVSTDELMI